MVILLIFILAGPFGATQDQFGVTHDPSNPGEGYTVIDFAASWCKPCWKALPFVNALAPSGVRVLVISEDEHQAGRDKLVKKLNLTVPVIWDEGHLWANHYQPKGMPTTFILDGDGKIIYSHVGFSKKSWQTFLVELSRVTGKTLN